MLDPSIVATAFACTTSATVLPTPPPIPNGSLLSPRILAIRGTIVHTPCRPYEQGILDRLLSNFDTLVDKLINPKSGNELFANMPLGPEKLDYIGEYLAMIPWALHPNYDLPPFLAVLENLRRFGLDKDAFKSHCRYMDRIIASSHVPDSDFNGRLECIPTKGSPQHMGGAGFAIGADSYAKYSSRYMLSPPSIPQSQVHHPKLAVTANSQAREGVGFAWSSGSHAVRVPGQIRPNYMGDDSQHVSLQRSPSSNRDRQRMGMGQIGPVRTNQRRFAAYPFPLTTSAPAQSRFRSAEFQTAPSSITTGYKAHSHQEHRKRATEATTQHSKVITLQTSDSEGSAPIPQQYFPSRQQYSIGGSMNGPSQDSSSYGIQNRFALGPSYHYHETQHSNSNSESMFSCNGPRFLPNYEHNQTMINVPANLNSNPPYHPFQRVAESQIQYTLPSYDGQDYQPQEQILYNEMVPASGGYPMQRGNGSQGAGRI
ncbi:hypothetical protein WAI453_011467 [Rhynchosporium graminicola]